MNAVPGTAGYAENADALVAGYESIAFADQHRPVLHLLPAMPGLVLEIGAGSGRDAAALAAMGHRVLAVEPVAALRSRAASLHPDPRIEWLDDSLPELARVTARGERFDLILLTAVWMHLDPAERRRAMPILAGLLRAAGRMIFAIRHGPVPPGRHMFAVPAAETPALAQAAGLTPVLNCATASLQPANRDAGVTWARLAFIRGPGSRPSSSD